MDETAFPAMWLRDNCGCSDCRDTRNGQKLFQITEIPLDIAVSSWSEDHDEISVTFNDGHRSVFDRTWLARHQHGSDGDGRTEDDKVLWRATDLPDGPPATSWERYCDDAGERLRLLRAVARFGCALVRRTPAEPGTVLVIAQSFGYVRVTNYGELFDVKVEVTPNNLAFTGLAIPPHTDNPYRDPVPTLQLLHCLTNAVEGGESGLVDGFEAARTLRAEEPGGFRHLTETLVSFAWSDAGTRLRAARPLIELDPKGRIRGVRFNNRSMEALAASCDVNGFYDAYRHLAAVIGRPELQLSFKLVPGDCLIVDNTRVLHARGGFQDSAAGTRHLQGCYADIDGLFSSIAVLAATS